MGRPQRAAEGGYVYHVLNRANARMTIFAADADYEAFEQFSAEAAWLTETRLLAYCVMPNHWHLLVWPRTDGELSRFVGWLTLTHTQRWHAHRHSAGSGHVYQGRFKSFPVQEDEHFSTVARYVERNAARAHLVRRAEQWRWGSLARWLNGSSSERQLLAEQAAAAQGELGGPRQCAAGATELVSIRRSVQRGCPFGESTWSERTSVRLGLEATFRPRGRPKKESKGS